MNDPSQDAPDDWPQGTAEAVRSLLRSHGATAEAAPVLAAQLLKRARQLATSRRQMPLEALAHLLRLTVDARSGLAPRLPDSTAP